MGQGQRKGRPTRAEAVEIDRRIRDVAIESFIDNGFDGTTMEGIAAAAGVTRRTLYQKFPDKEALFAAVVPAALASSLRGVELEVADGPLEDVLRSLAHQIIARLVEPRAVRLRRFAMLESERLASLDEAAGIQVYLDSIQAMVEVLRAHAELGEVAVDDLQTAGDLFVALVAGGSTIMADFGRYRSPEEERQHVDAAVALFLNGVLPREAGR